MNLSEIFWNSSVEDIKKGYVYSEKMHKYICLICGKTFEKGIIYHQDGVFYEAEKYVSVHIRKEHGSIFDCLVNMNKKYTGLSESQMEAVRCFREGMKDKEIAERMGIENTSTIRGYRFKFKEKEKEAKVFLAMMGLVNDANRDEAETITNETSHKDKRYFITEKERGEILKDCFKGEEGRLIVFPTKEKTKLLVLNYISEFFEPQRKYTEEEVNSIIEGVYDDYDIVRESLVEYGYLERNKDKTSYWLKE